MAAEAAITVGAQHQVAVPLHIQRVEQSLRLDPLLNYVEDLLQKSTVPQSDVETSTDADTDLDIDKPSHLDAEGNKVYNGIITSRTERRADKTRLYNFTKVKKSRKWLKNLLLSDSSSDEEDDNAVTQEHLKDMLKMHKFQQKCRVQFYRDPEMQQYQYYSVGMLSNYDKFSEHQKMIIGPRKKISKEQKRLEKKMKAKMKKMKEKMKQGREMPDGRKSRLTEVTIHQPGRPPKVRKLTQEQIAAKRRKIWVALAKKEIPKAQKQKASARKEAMQQLKKVAKDCQKECRRAAMQSQRVMKECGTRARRLSREMLAYWKRFEKVEKEHRKKAEKEALEQRKMDVELREMKRQQRKLNFLITQTELYAHFMARKLTGEAESGKDAILHRLEEKKDQREKQVDGGLLTYTPEDDYDSEAMKNLALNNVQAAVTTHVKKTRAYDCEIGRVRRCADTSLANPAMGQYEEQPQPFIFQGKLKGYQLKGMNWLANLYHQGINGILADEMGLGKTVQSISLLAHLAESQGIWGPFLVIAPASTLHNWQQEVTKFTPCFKVVPYWGNTQDRKVLRKFWNAEQLHTQNASFHVVVTSYQLVIQDVKYFQRIKWQYMILDEAQALKSTSSVRWKMLLGFNCRNRLLLSGTPIQNSMAELWALLHFIMPTLFDSHDEFNEWFSKDIESHAEKQSGIDENQLSRLHMILKPFMLRRVKKDVENELSDKIEILVYCPLTTRQRLLYQAVKNKISIEDLLQSSANTSTAQCSTSSLMNLVMQFRKVCNHPELFERREVRSPFQMKLGSYHIPKLIYRDGLIESAVPSHQRLLYNMLSVFNPVHIHQSLSHHHCTKQKGAEHVHSSFSFLRFVNQSPAELHNMMLAGLLVRWLAVFLWLKEAYTINHQKMWHRPWPCRRLGKRGLILEPHTPLSPSNLASSPNLRGLVFTSPRSTVYCHYTHVLHCMPETVGHRKIRLRRLSGKMGHGPIPGPSTVHSPPGSKTPLSPTRSPTKLPSSPSKLTFPEPDPLRTPHRHIPRRPQVLKCQPTDFPAFLYRPMPRAHALYQELYVSDRSAAWDWMRGELCGTLEARQSLLYGNVNIAERVRWKKLYFYPCIPEGLLAIEPRHGYSGVYVPDKETLVTDAGKLYVLDTLLARLKAEGHRVLIYSQMTRMIDLLEEYMWHRKHTYMRLDGSSKISDRRDMVADFQSRSDIFVFLLSTRAGGLGINLTAADTVIFYDSDWNPTVDQQAMDRAHRLGQTKQVTVYRLICKGTIEERILQRAKEKSEIQKMVISGGNFRPDTLKPKEVVSLLLDDDEMEKKLLQKAEEKKTKDTTNKEKDRERKRKKYAAEKKGTGRGPGRPKKVKVEEVNMTIPATDIDSILSVSVDSTSAAASPMSVGSEAIPLGADDSSNEGLVIVDDAHTTFPPVTPTSTPPPPKRGTGRPRGRPRGSGVGRRPRGRGSIRKAISAAEIAGAQAGKSAAFAAYGYNFQGTSPSRAGSSPSSPPTRGGHTARGTHSPQTPPRGSANSTPRGSPHGFYAQRNTPS